MRRRPELIRDILIHVEADESDPLTWVDINIETSSPIEISYHVDLLAQAGFLHAVNLTTLDGYEWKASGLTWHGHELLDAIRDDTVWNKTLERLGTVGGWTLPVLQALASDVLRKQLGI